MKQKVKENLRIIGVLTSACILTFALFAAALLIFCTCSATPSVAQTTTSVQNQRTATPEVKVDTIHCESSCIVKFTEVPNSKGTNTRIYAVYNDTVNNISEMIPVSKSVYEYIQLCKENKIIPNLGIRLKNGQIVSIIKYKPRYFIKK